MPGKNVFAAFLVGLLTCSCPITSRAADGPTPAAAKALSVAPRTALPARRDAAAFSIRGTVVDEHDSPLSNIKVAAVEGLGRTPDFLTQSDGAGKFAFNLPGRYSVSLVASDAAGERMGFLTFYDVRDRRGGPLRLALRKSRAIPVTVVDGKGQPIADAKIHADFHLFSPRVAPRQLIEQATDAQGKALLRVPSDMPLAYVFAVKSGAGFDYVIYCRPEGQRRARIQRPAAIDPLRRAPDDSRPINFVLSGAHKVRVHVVDGRRRALPGVRVQTDAIVRANRGGQAFLYGVPEFDVVSDQQGIAEFNAIPVDAMTPLNLSTPAMGQSLYAQLTFNPADPVTEFTVVARQLPVLRVQVTWPDGRPALGARIHYSWRPYFVGRIGPLHTSTRLYDAAGDLDLVSFTSDAYCVVTATSDGFVSAMEARVARLEEPVRPVHLVLKPAVHVRGTLTWGKEHRPDENDAVTLVERDDDLYAKLPEEERLPRTHPLADVAHVAIDVPLRETTDDRGRFDFEVPPGRYVIGPGAVYLSAESEKTTNVADLFDEPTREFEIKDQKQVEINLEREDPSAAVSREKGRPHGLDRIRLLVTYPNGRPAPEAKTQYAARIDGRPENVIVGTNRAERTSIHFRRDGAYAISATSDGFASAIVNRVARTGQPVEPVHLILKPAARVHGRITVGKNRQPATNMRFLLIQRNDDSDPKPPASERSPQDRTTQNSPTAADIPISNATNRRGRFEFYAAPGRYVLIPERRPLGSGFNPQELPTLLKNGAKEFQVKDETDIELNVRLE
ncbi:MAG TPA: carboxypeptidase-like regulatory domain-containing protein [Planctomycetaceae bacterium]|nr:carboxypeptidase-like regulatory domain-containing protein [Planctomycetaceae bacterium]